jgi:hypothetical protein
MQTIKRSNNNATMSNIFTIMSERVTSALFLSTILTRSTWSITRQRPSKTSTVINKNNNNQTTAVNNQTSIIGQLIYEGQGKIVGQRVITPETLDGTHKIEVSYAGYGTFNGVSVTETRTFANTHRPDGVIQAV